MVLATANAVGALTAMARVSPGFTVDIPGWMQGIVIKLFARHVLRACNVFTIKISHLNSFTGPILHVFNYTFRVPVLYPIFLGS